MPIALLLQETTAAFRFGARVLDPWTYLVRLEELLIDRARGAFLVHWFGERIPLHGAQVRVNIINLDALRKRYLDVNRQFEATENAVKGPNLTEPIFGIVGVLAGTLLTPGVVLGSAIAVFRKVKLGVGRTLGVLAFVILGPVIGALSPVLGIGAIAGEAALGIANDPSARAAFDFLGETAKLLVAARKFINLLLGDRSAIHNPILAGILAFADQLAKLFPFALALIAVVVTRLGPRLLPLVAQIKAFAALVGDSLDVIGFIVTSLVTDIKAVFTGPGNIVSSLKGVLAMLTRPARSVLKIATSFFETGRAVVRIWYSDVLGQVESYQKVAPLQLKNSIDLIPSLLRIRRIVAVVELASKIFKSATAGPGSPPSVGPPDAMDAWLGKAKAFGGDAGAVFGSFPKLPTVEGPGSIVDRLGLVEAYGIPSDIAAYKELIKGNLPPVSADVAKYVERARHPASAFAFERKALTRELGDTPVDALAAAHMNELKLRTLIEEVVGRILPPKLRELAPSLADAFKSVDDTLTFEKKPIGKKTAGKGPKPPLPVKQVAEDDRPLVPVVQRLVIRSTTGTRDDLYDFVVRLQKKINHPYLARA